MLDAELVEREVDPSDRRAFTLKVSRRGAAALKDALARIERHEQQLLAGFTDEESRILLDLLGVEDRALQRPRAPGKPPRRMLGQARAKAAKERKVLRRRK